MWQYYIDNGRAIKPDGWAISVAGNRTEAELHRSCAMVDYFFSEEGSTLQNYGLPMMLEEEPYVGPDGISYPKFNTWVTETCEAVAKGDLSTFLRDWIGSLIPVGFQKNIGFEYQYTSQRGFAGWELLQNSTCTFATYSGGRITTVSGFRESAVEEACQSKVIKPKEGLSPSSVPHRVLRKLVLLVRS